MKTNSIEILAPAGSFETLQTAIDAGADAVYFGISDFNMRATAAANFINADIPKIVKLCKASKVKPYITLNTLLYDNELGRMREIVNEVKENGIDAVIAADMATIEYARSKDVEVHISTQLSISNIESLKFYSQFSDRVVLARELTLEQVAEIIREIREQDIRGPKGNLVEIEVFAHGALCVAVSGRCSMSMYCYNTSANRGKCSQMCRRQYKVTDISTGKELVIDNNYVMSSADLCTIGMLPELVATGVNVLKFEGRGRSAEYVDTIIRTYKEALNAIEDGTYSNDKIKKWNEDLGTVFNRGFTQNFYMGRKIGEWAGVHGSKATQERIHIGAVEHYYPKVKVAQVKIQAKDEFKTGDEYIITGPTTGLEKGIVKSLVVNDKETDKAKQGDTVTFKVNKKVRKNDRLYVLRERESFIPRGKEKLIEKAGQRPA